MKSVKSRSISEKIKKVYVELKELRKTKRGQGVYSVRIDLESRDQILTDRTMADFRKLNKTLEVLDPKFEFVQVLPPAWADEIPLSTSQARGRARSLTKYLAHNTKGRDVFDVLIIQWARAKKGSLMNAQGSSKVQLNSSDSRAEVLNKMSKALSYVYQLKKSEAIDWFVGKNSIGQMAQVRYEWAQRDQTEVNLSKWEYILVIQQRTRYDGWWYGQKANGKKGLFPSNYVEILNPSEIKKRLKGPKRSRATGNNVSASGEGANLSSSAPYLKQQTDTSRRPGTEAKHKTKLGISRAATDPINAGPARDRKIETGFCVKSTEAYDELRSIGVSIEGNGRYLAWKKRPSRGPKNGDFVQLGFSAYVWDPQSQQLREFSSSDRLKDPPKGVSSGEAGANGVMMEFVVGKKEVIDGLEEAVRQLELNGKYRAIIAPSKGYGDVGSPPEIPGNCYLVYDLHLKEVKQAGTFAPPPLDRANIFSVGISRPPVQIRPQQRSMTEFKGMKSMNLKHKRRKHKTQVTPNGY